MLEGPIDSGLHTTNKTERHTWLKASHKNVYTLKVELTGNRHNSRIIKYGAMIHSIWTDYAFNNACHRQFSGMAYYYRQVHVYTIKGTCRMSASMMIPRCSGHTPNLLSIRIWTNKRLSLRHDVSDDDIERLRSRRRHFRKNERVCPGLVPRLGCGVLTRGAGYLPVGRGTCPWVGLGWRNTVPHFLCYSGPTVVTIIDPR